MKTTRLFLIITAAAMVIRVVYLLMVPQVPEYRYFNFDEADYELIAKNLYEGRGFSYREDYPTAFRPPLYPLFVAGVYSLVGERNHAAIQWSQAVLSAVCAGLIFLVGQLVFGRWAGICAGAIFSIYPTMLYYVPKLLTETLFIALLAGAVCLLVAAIRGGTVLQFCLAGLGFGAAYLCRPVLLPFLAVLFPSAFLLLAKRRKLAKAGLLLLGFYMAFAATISPWVIRNWITFHEFIPTDTHLGWVFWHNTGVHFDFDEDFSLSKTEIDAKAAAGQLTSESFFDAIQRYAHFGADAQRDGIRKAYHLTELPRTETEISRFFLGKTVEFYKANVLRLVRDRIANFVNFWMPISSIEGRKGEYLYTYGVIAILAAFGLVIVIKEHKLMDSLVLLAVVLNFWIATTLFIYHSRLKMPADVVTIVFAGFAIDWVWRRKGRLRLAALIGGAVAINVLLGRILIQLKELAKSVL